MKLRDALVLSPPLALSALAAMFSVEGSDTGSWLARAIVFTTMFGFSIWVWRRQLKRFPDDPWRFRL